MNWIFLDFESYFDTKAKYDLKSMTMTEYIRDEMFLAHGAGLAINDGEPRWITGAQLPDVFRLLEASRPFAVICHNAKFDGAILKWRYGVTPDLLICTQAMARAVLGNSVPSHALKALAEFYGFPPKGDMLTNGLRDLTPFQEKELAEYCLRDV